MSNLSTTSEDILRCAQSLIVAGGYNGFSYADISKVVGIRSASIHHHFPFKSDLVGTLVARYREQATAGIAELERNIADPANQLRAYLGYWEMCITDASASVCICAMLASEIPVLPENVVLEVRAHFRSLSAWLASVLENGAEQGHFRLTDAPQIEAECFMATVHGAMLSARAYGDAGLFGLITRPLLQNLIIQN